MHQFKRINYTPHVYNAMNEEIGIEEFVEENQTDLIAMTTRGRSGLMKIFLPSIAEGVFKHEQVPLLLINVKSGLYTQTTLIRLSQNKSGI
jgi:Universal stress protein family